MKIQKYATGYKGKYGQIKTSGGGNFEGYLGNYDPESNTIDVWDGLQRTRVDADKIVSTRVQFPFGVILLVIIWVVGMFLLLDITKRAPTQHQDSSYNFNHFNQD